MGRSRVLHVIWLTLIFSIAAVLLYFSLRGIQWKVVGETIRHISPGFALLSIAISMIPMYVRAARWQLLLQAEAPVSMKTTFWAVCAGYFGNNFLPARGGEVVRSYIVRSRSELGLSYVLATALSERVADAVALVLVGAVLLLFMPEAAGWMKLARGPFALIGVVGVFGIAFLPWLEKPLHGLLTRVPRLQGMMQQMLLGVRSFHNWQRVMSFAAMTAVIWSMDALTTTTVAHAMNIDLSIAKSMLLIVALSLSSAFPSTPGFVGVFQFVAVMVLKPFGISSSIAIAFMLVSQVLNYLVTTVLGLLAMTRYTPFSWRSIKN